MTRKDPNHTDDGADPTRREFFRTFGRESIRNVGSVVGAASEIRRATSVAAQDIFAVPGAGRPAEHEESPETVDASFNSAYRLGDGAILALDQRELPGRMSILSLREPTEVSSAIRSTAINGGPILGEVAAYALTLVAQRMAGAEQDERDRAFSAATNTLRTPRTDVHALGAAIARMESAYSRDPHALKAEADNIASAAQAAYSALGRAGASFVAQSSPEGTINLLMHGDMGPLTSGMVGTGTALINSLLSDGRAVHVWITEAAPSNEGARVAALQLTQLDVPHTVIADTAVAWLLASRHIDAALVRGDTVGSNGDTLAPIGSLNVATLATAADVPVLVIAPGTSFDDTTADVRSLVLELRSPAEGLPASPTTPAPRPTVFGVRLNPTVDVIPRSFVSGYVTESGVHPGGRT